MIRAWEPAPRSGVQGAASLGEPRGRWLESSHQGPQFPCDPVQFCPVSPDDRNGRTRNGAAAPEPQRSFPWRFDAGGGLWRGSGAVGLDGWVWLGLDVSRLGDSCPRCLGKQTGQFFPSRGQFVCDRGQHSTGRAGCGASMFGHSAQPAARCSAPLPLLLLSRPILSRWSKLKLASSDLLRKGKGFALP
jgi:hypothetical protein